MRRRRGYFLRDLSGQVLQDDDLARLLAFPNALVTSHQAFLTQEALGDIARTTVANLEGCWGGAGGLWRGSVLGGVKGKCIFELRFGVAGWERAGERELLNSIFS